MPHWQAKSIAYVLPQSHAKEGLTREEAFFANAAADVSKLPRGAAYEAADVADDAYPDGKLADETIRRLRAAKDKPDEPWFIAVGFLKPHLPFCAPKKYWDLYDPAAFHLAALKTPPVGAPKFAPTTWGELRQYSDIPDTGPLDDANARKLIHGYHAAVGSSCTGLLACLFGRWREDGRRFFQSCEQVLGHERLDKVVTKSGDGAVVDVLGAAEATDRDGVRAQGGAGTLQQVPAAAARHSDVRDQHLAG